MHGVAYLEIEYGQAAGVRYIFPSALYVSLICLPVIIYPRWEDISPTSAYEIQAAPAKKTCVVIYQQGLWFDISYQWISILPKKVIPHIVSNDTLNRISAE